MRKTILTFALPLFALFLLFIFYFLLPKTSFAQTASSSATTTPNYQYQSPNFSPQSPHSASLAIYNFGHAMSCILAGQSPLAPCLEYKIYKDTQGMMKSTPYLSNVNTNSGLLGMSISMVGEVISTPPIRSSEFIADLGEQLGIKSANAQVGGSGSTVLTPIFKLWEVSRNIAYLVMILIFVLVGLMVMFRQKLNPQTVVSIQMALPGLVIGLVMITFSYFLASLISDTAFLGTNLINYYFSLAQGQNSPPQPALISPNNEEQNLLQIYARNIGILHSGLNPLRGGDPGNIKQVLDSIWQNIDSDAEFWIRFMAGSVVATTGNSYTQGLQAFPSVGQGLQIIANIGTFVSSFSSPTSALALILSWLSLIIILYSMFRLLLRLINSLLSIIFLTITAPFQFLAASIPGRQGIATSWFFNMLCNALAFPAVYAVLYFAAFLLHRTDPAFYINMTSGVPLAGGQTFPLLGGMNLNFLNVLIAFGALVATPSIPDVICKAVGKPGQLGGAVAGAISGGISAGQRYNDQSMRGVQTLTSRASALPSKPGYYGHQERDGSVSWHRSWDPHHGAHMGALQKTWMGTQAGVSGAAKLPGIRNIPGADRLSQWGQGHGSHGAHGSTQNTTTKDPWEDFGI